MAAPPKRALFIAPKWVALALILLLGLSGLWWMGRPPTPVTLVYTTHAVPAYTQLTAADLITATSSLAVNGVFTTVAAAIGQITTAALPAQTVLTVDKLWKPHITLSDWRIVTVPLSATVPPAVGETVLVIGVDANTSDATEISQQALVLGVENSNAVVAMPSAEANRAVTYLIGNRRLLLIRRLP